MTANDLILRSLRLIGAIATGETPSSNEGSDALSVLNGMLDAWSSENLAIYQTVRESFVLTPAKQTYTIGVTGDLNTSRPSKILQAGVESPGGPNPTNELPVDIINVQQWAGIVVKNTQGTLPLKLYAEGAFPLERINLWPIPNVANNLVIYSLKPLAAFVNLTDTFTMPPGYQQAIEYNLAEALAPEYGKTPSPFISAKAVETKASIKRQNTKPEYMISDVVGMGEQKPFNWITGQ